MVWGGMKKSRKEIHIRGRSSLAAASSGGQAPAAAKKEEKKVGVVSGTPADSFDETAELKHDKKVAIYISVLAVLLAIAATGSNDAMKTAQQAGFQGNDHYAYYQSKYVRQSQLKLAEDQLQLKLDETPNLDSLPEAARKLIQTKKAEYDKEIQKLETDGRHGKTELLALAKSCDNQRKVALAQHPFYDYSMAMLQIAIVLASASIIMGTLLSSLRQLRSGRFRGPAFPEWLFAFLRGTGVKARQGRCAGEGRGSHLAQMHRGVMLLASQGRCQCRRKAVFFAVGQKGAENQLAAVARQ